MAFFCPVCNTEFKIVKLEKYNRCIKCNASVLLSKIDCVASNREYFNRIADIYDESKINHCREQKYYRLESFYNRFHGSMITKYHKLIKEADKLFIDGKSLEIGFGSGDELYKKLESGCDACGIDLSEENVKKFKSKYKNYKDKVFWGNAEDLSVGKYDLVYSNALFEHLDSPQKFLKGAFSCLREGA